MNRGLNRERFKKDVLVKNSYEKKFQKMEEERTDALEMAEKENEERKAQEKGQSQSINLILISYNLLFHQY